MTHHWLVLMDFLKHRGLSRPLQQSSNKVVLQDNEILVSYDVKSLLAIIPVEELIEICEKCLRDDDTLVQQTNLAVTTIITLL